LHSDGAFGRELSHVGVGDLESWKWLDWEPFVKGEEKVLHGGNVTSLGNNYERDGKTCQGTSASRVWNIVDFRLRSRAC